jgi:hypothetical protein
MDASSSPEQGSSPDGSPALKGLPAGSPPPAQYVASPTLSVAPESAAFVSATPFSPGSHANTSPGRAPHGLATVVNTGVRAPQARLGLARLTVVKYLRNVFQADSYFLHVPVLHAGPRLAAASPPRQNR